MKKHPNLAKKLQLLYTLRVNPDIQTNVELAEQLSVTKQAVSKWCHGTPTLTGQSIPDYQLIPLADLFDIDPFWFTLEMEEFESRIKKKIDNEKKGPVEQALQTSIATLPNTALQILGRDHELKKLTQYWQQSRTNVVQVLAFGGVGKSTLINKWLSDMSSQRYRHATRVYAWSFYWQGHASDMKSSGDFFIEHALQWFGDEKPGKGTPWAKASRLAKLIRSYKTLLILDGLEPLQYPPGPKVGQVENPAVALLIKELAAENSGLCVITSRLRASDLESFEDGRVETLCLDNLSLEDGTNLLKNLGVEGTENEYIDAVETYAGHPLSLSLLAGYLKVVHNGAISKYRELDSLLDEKNQSEHVRNLMQAYLKWFEGNRTRELLYLIVLFDRAVSVKDIQKITQFDSIPELTSALSEFSKEEWQYAITLLESAQLVSKYYRNDEPILDCHPIVRDFISDHIKSEFPEFWIRSHSFFFDYLRQKVGISPQSMMELEPLFRAVVHGVEAKRTEEAFQIYFNDIKKRQFSISAEMSHHADHASLRAFFKREWDQPTDAISEDAQAYLLTSAATNLIYLGNIEEALSPCNKSIEWFLNNDKYLEAASAAGPLASMLIAAGDLRQTFKLIDKIRPAIEKTQNSLVRAIAQNFEAYALYLNGENEKAKRMFENSDRIITQPLIDQDKKLGTISAYYCKFLLDTGRIDEALERALKTIAWRKRGSWQVEIDTTSQLASDMLIMGLILLKNGDLINAELYLNQQVELLRSSDEWLYLPTGLNSRAQFYTHIGEYDLALNDLNESIEISKRTGARFSEWEACIELARLSLYREELKDSKMYLQRAEQIDGMDAYNFRNQEIAELKLALSA